MGVVVAICRARTDVVKTIRTNKAIMSVCSTAAFIKLLLTGYYYRNTKKNLIIKIQKKHVQNVMLVEMASEISNTSVWIAQDTTESRVPRLNVHTN